VILQVAQKLKEFLLPAPRPFTPENALELLLAEHAYEAEPQRLFNAFRSSQVLLVVAGMSKAGKLQLITSTELNGHKFAYVFTSEAAMSHSLKKSKIASRKVAHLNGRAVLEMMDEAGLGLMINSGHDEMVLIAPEKIKSALV